MTVADGSMTHVVVTRFNVAILDRAAPSEDWLRQRLDLFGDVTLPSMLSQVVAPDHWLIFCDAASPAWFRHRLGSMIPPWAELVWVEGPFRSDRVSHEVGLRAAAGTLLTTRLDNDDCVARDFISAIQEKCVPGEPYFINFTVGAQYQDGRFYYRLDPSNAFISFVEPASTSPRTVLLDTHNRLGRHAPITQVHTHPVWLQIIHGGNQANVVRGVRVHPSRVVPYFEVKLDVVQSGRAAIALDKVKTTLGIAVRVARSRHRLTWLLRSLRASGSRRGAHG